MCISINSPPPSCSLRKSATQVSYLKPSEVKELTSERLFYHKQVVFLSTPLLTTHPSRPLSKSNKLNQGKGEGKICISHCESCIHISAYAHKLYLTRKRGKSKRGHILLSTILYGAFSIILLTYLQQMIK